MPGPHPQHDPDGSRRATLLARLEYDLDPRTDARRDAVYTGHPTPKKEAR